MLNLNLPIKRLDMEITITSNLMPFKLHPTLTYQLMTSFPLPLSKALEA